MPNKPKPKIHKKIKVTDKTYRRIGPDELSDIAEELGANVVEDEEEIRRILGKMNRRRRP